VCRFAVSVDPGNAALQARRQRIEELRAQGEATVPSLLGGRPGAALRPPAPHLCGGELLRRCTHARSFAATLGMWWPRRGGRGAGLQPWHRPHPSDPAAAGEELDTNPFLRAGDQGLRAQLGLGAGAEDWQVGAAPLGGLLELALRLQLGAGPGPGLRC
jgi:hypothetical protein